MVDDTATADQLAQAYFERWTAEDFDGLGALFAADVDFVGPMGVAHGVEACIGGLTAVRGMVDDIKVVRRWVDGGDAVTWFEFHRDGHDPLPVVNWSHADHGRISRIRVTFDPRPLLAG